MRIRINSELIRTAVAQHGQRASRVSDQIARAFSNIQLSSDAAH
jgi:hypothetical protein